MSEVDEQSPATSVSELEKDPRGTVKRWLLELEMADQEEKDWRKEGQGVFEVYEASKANSQAKFNILWSNTETLQPAVYNSAPEPDVRRRFRDKDVLGKYTSEVMERALSSEIDNDDYDTTIEDVVLDVLLPGRGLARVKYVPTTSPMDDIEQETVEIDGETTEPEEEIVDENAPIEHVQWDDFRHGRGKRWKDVPWIAFRHDMTKDDLVEMFGEEVANLVKLTDKEADSEDDENKKVFRTAEIWEIWDKDKRRVLFICKSYKDRPLKEADDPLGLPGFWPVPRPVYAIRNSRSLLPVPLYRQYKKTSH